MPHRARRAVLALIVIAVPTVASAQTADPQLRADIRRLMEATNVSAMGVQMANALSPVILQNLKKSNPELPDAATEVIRDVLTAELSKMFVGPQSVENQMIDLYAKHFTREEVSELLKFYTSPVGRKAVARMPLVTQEGAGVGTKWLEGRMPAISKVLQQRLREKGFLK